MRTVLVVVPDYLSHWLPMGSLAAAWAAAGDRVVVATGPAIRPRAAAAGHDVVDLVLGPASNPGVARPGDQPAGEANRLAGFFAATRRGAVATLRYQADERTHDLLWRPDAVAARMAAVLGEVRPDVVLADHLAFGATLALRALGRTFASVAPGHPSSVPGPGEVYGLPPAWPAAVTPDPVAVEGLRRRCLDVQAAFTGEYNRALRALEPAAPPVRDAFAAAGRTVLHLYPEALVRRPVAGRHYLGSAGRRESLPGDLHALLRRDPDRPTAYVSLGTFLSVRDDVLATLVEGLRPAGARVVLATGAADPADLPDLPDGSVARPVLPQVAVLDRCDVVLTHGGNNTVTEALTAGLPLVVAPLSTDQFAIAADVERCGMGAVVDPNRATPADVAAAVAIALSPRVRARAARLGQALRADPGPARARALLSPAPAPAA